MEPVHGCAAVVLNWNGWRDTLACVHSLLQARPAPGRIIVCDNGSSDGSLLQLQAGLRDAVGAALVCTSRSELRAAGDDAAAAVAQAGDVWLVDNAANLGYAGGNNVGLRLALHDPRCSHVWILNNDTVVAPDALGQLLDHMTARPDIGLCGSTLVYDHDRQMVQAFGGSTYTRWSGRTRHLGAHTRLADLPARAEPVEARMACVVGAAMLARREWFAAAGLLTEDYFLYFEEIDWATRAARAVGAGPQLGLGWAPRSIVFHKEGASVGTAASGGSPLSLFYLFRNRLRFAFRFHRLFLPTVLLSTFWDIAKLAARARWPQARAALRGALQLPPPGAAPTLQPQAAVRQ